MKNLSLIEYPVQHIPSKYVDKKYIVSPKVNFKMKLKTSA